MPPSFRVVGGDRPPTLLMDEVDAIFGPKRATARTCGVC
jgi:hypothetical protein